MCSVAAHESEKNVHLVSTTQQQQTTSNPNDCWTLTQYLERRVVEQLLGCGSLPGVAVPTLPQHVLYAPIQVHGNVLDGWGLDLDLPRPILACRRGCVQDDVSFLLQIMCARVEQFKITSSGSAFDTVKCTHTHTHTTHTHTYTHTRVLTMKWRAPALGYLRTQGGEPDTM